MNVESTEKAQRPRWAILAVVLASGVLAGIAAVLAIREYQPVLVGAYFFFTFLAVLGFSLSILLPSRDRTSIILSGLALAIPVVTFCCIAFPISGVQKVRTSAARTQTAGHLCQISTALMSFNDVHGHLPPAAVKDKDGRLLLSWRVAVLPYMEHQELYKQFRLDEAWDSPHNLALLDQMPTVYQSLYFNEEVPRFHTRVQVIVGPGTLFDEADFPISLSKSVPDGLGETVLLVEAAQAVPWTKPEDVVYRPDGPFPDLGGMINKGQSLFGPEQVRALQVMTASRVWHYLEYPLDEPGLRAAFVRNDGKGWSPR